MIQMRNEILCKQSQSVLFIVRVIRHSLKADETPIVC